MTAKEWVLNINPKAVCKPQVSMFEGVKYYIMPSENAGFISRMSLGEATENKAWLSSKKLIQEKK